MLPKTESKPSRPGTDRYTDSVDWDRVADDYFNWILGPLASVMVTPDPRKSNMIRNVLITRLLEFPDLKQMRILDYGCGPGNLLEVISGKVGKIYGLDISDRALAIASEKAANLDLEFIPMKGDMRTYVSEEKFDVIISINSLLPTKRTDIALMLKKVLENLSTTGRFLAIVPSFDTCVALAEHWEESYKEHSKNHKHVKMCAAAFKAAKKMDKETLSFADDGVHIQCFHTKESIEKEFPKAGLRIVGDLEKVEYPWEYARDFDYGYFPHKPEIWDWFVEAVKEPAP